MTTFGAPEAFVAPFEKIAEEGENAGYQVLMPMEPLRWPKW